MPPLALRDATAAAALRDALDTMRLGAEPILETVLPEMRALFGVDGMIAYRFAPRADGWHPDLIHIAYPQASALVHQFCSFAPRAPERFAWYDAMRPEPAQRNRVIEPTAVIPEEEFQALAIAREVLRPVGIDRHRQLRVLLCERGSLVAWFGAIHVERFTGRQRSLLAALGPAVRRRLALERRMGSEPLVHAALEAALARLGAPSFVIDAQGAVLTANAAGWAELSRCGRELLRGLRDATLRRPSAYAFDLTRLSDGVASPGWLAILRCESEAARLAMATAQAADRWGLTPRQRAVLDLLARGLSNAAIAAELGIGDRAVELHVSAIFDRAGVESRAALMARVLAMRAA